jgi:aspartyl-tRNA(Asn)/glutamyl-tRNA(Gln) amidotransferase subunit A
MRCWFDLETYQNHAGLYARNTRVGNILDLCGLSLPCGITGKGLPISLMICGKPFAEDMILRVGHAYEQATDWHKVLPDLSWID